MDIKKTEYQRRRPEKSLLYKTLANNLNSFLANLSSEGRSLPEHVEKELWAFLECGILAYGFVRVKCDSCPFEHIVAFSCKKRGFCPACGAKRMSEISQHLVDNIIPRVNVRQYVLSVPIPLRYWMASNKKLTAKVHKIFASSVDRFYVRRKNQDSKSGSITFVQRFGSALNLNVHFHLLQLEGVYIESGSGEYRFSKVSKPNNQDVKDLLQEISHRVVKLLRKQGYLKEVHEQEYVDVLFEEEPTYASCMSASVQHRIALGLRKGQKVRFIGSGFGYEGESPHLKGSRCVELNGFSLHANVNVAWHRKDQLENLINYVARPSLSTKRMSLRSDGNIEYELKRKWSNGVTHVMLSPMELIEKLCALVPLPRMHLVRYWGVLAPNSKIRKKIIPGKTRAELKEESNYLEGEEEKRKANSSWSKVLARTFQIDVSLCPKCEGSMRMISSITDPHVIEKILSHLGLCARPPPVASAKIQELSYEF